MGRGPGKLDGGGGGHVAFLALPKNCFGLGDPPETSPRLWAHPPERWERAWKGWEQLVQGCSPCLLGDPAKAVLGTLAPPLFPQAPSWLGHSNESL